MFYVGQRVCCVNSGWLLSENLNPVTAETVLVEGNVYTVVAVLTAKGKFGIRVAEVDARPRWGFLAERFRPVVDRPTDISVFTAMLSTKPAEIDA